MEEYLKKVMEQIRCKKVHSYIERELRDHMEDQIRENVSDGMSQEEAVPWLCCQLFRKWITVVSGDENKGVSDKQWRSELLDRCSSRAAFRFKICWKQRRKCSGSRSRRKFGLFADVSVVNVRTSGSDSCMRSARRIDFLYFLDFQKAE